MKFSSKHRENVKSQPEVPMSSVQSLANSWGSVSDTWKETEKGAKEFSAKQPEPFLRTQPKTLVNSNQTPASSLGGVSRSRNETGNGVTQFSTKQPEPLQTQPKPLVNSNQTPASSLGCVSRSRNETGNAQQSCTESSVGWLPLTTSPPVQTVPAQFMDRPTPGSEMGLASTNVRSLEQKVDASSSAGLVPNQQHHLDSLNKQSPDASYFTSGLSDNSFRKAHPLAAIQKPEKSEEERMGNLFAVYTILKRIQDHPFDEGYRILSINDPLFLKLMKSTDSLSLLRAVGFQADQSGKWRIEANDENWKTLETTVEGLSSILQSRAESSTGVPPVANPVHGTSHTFSSFSGLAHPGEPMAACPTHFSGFPGFNNATIGPSASSVFHPTPIVQGGFSVQGLNSAIAKISSQSYDSRNKCFAALVEVLNNIINFPDNCTYRTLLKNSESYQQQIGRIPGGEEFLKAVGFVDIEADQLTIEANPKCWTSLTQAVRLIRLRHSPSPEPAISGPSHLIQQNPAPPPPLFSAMTIPPHQPPHGFQPLLDMPAAQNINGPQQLPSFSPAPFPGMHNPQPSSMLQNFQQPPSLALPEPINLGALPEPIQLMPQPHLPLYQDPCIIQTPIVVQGPQSIPSGKIQSHSEIERELLHQGKTSTPKIDARLAGTLEEALAKISSYHSGIKDACLSAIFEIMKNMRDFPDEDHYRCLSKSNLLFQKNIGLIHGGEDILRAVGFEDHGDQLLLRPSKEKWSYIEVCLEMLSSVDFSLRPQVLELLGRIKAPSLQPPDPRKVLQTSVSLGSGFIQQNVHSEAMLQPSSISQLDSMQSQQFVPRQEDLFSHPQQPLRDQILQKQCARNASDPDTWSKKSFYDNFGQQNNQSFETEQPSISWNPGQETKHQNTPSTNSTVIKEDRSLCAFFKKTGKCRYGENCVFTHTSAQVPAKFEEKAHPHQEIKRKGPKEPETQDEKNNAIAKKKMINEKQNNNRYSQKYVPVQKALT